MTSGFLNFVFNEHYKEELYHNVLDSLITNCQKMLNDSKSKKFFLPNHEEKIRNYLFENYLSNDNLIDFRFEVPINYDPNTYTYKGIIDIQAVSKEHFSKNKKAFYIIECKRLDGTKSLNKKYVTQGVFRFIGDNPKYPSYNNKNFMLGFVVKQINLVNLINSINEIHSQELKDSVTQNITEVETSENYSLYESSYTKKLTLTHLFYNFSDIIVI